MKILMLGTKARGGMTSVVSAYLASGVGERYNIIYIPTHLETNPVYKYAYFLYSVLKSLRYLLDPDCGIVHLHTSKGGSLFRKGIFGVMAGGCGKKVVIHTHGADFFESFNRQSPFIKKQIKKIFERADLVIVLSEIRKNEYARIVDREKITVIPNFVTVPPPGGRKTSGKGAVRVLYLGRLGERKGTEDLIRAIKRIPDKNLVVELAGDGDLIKYRTLVGELGLGDVVTIPGWIEGRAKEALLEAADIFVLPSYHEDLPMGILEAMSYGLPIVSTNVAGIPELVQTGYNGFLVEPGDIDGLAEKIERLVRNQNLRKTMGSNSLELVKTKFDRAVVESRIIQLYERLT